MRVLAYGVISGDGFKGLRNKAPIWKLGGFGYEGVRIDEGVIGADLCQISISTQNR